jgi:hypothetical protein
MSRLIARRTRSRLLSSLPLLLLALVTTIGCGSTASPDLSTSRNSPEWISRPNRIDDEGSERAIYAVGMADSNPNRSMQLVQARTRGKAELARTVKVLVQSMVKDFMSSNRDYYESMDAASSVEYTEDISRQVTQQMLSGAKQWDDFHDPIDRTYFVLYRMDLDDVVLSYRDQMNAAFRREVTRRRILVDADDFEVDLDKQLAKLNGMSAEQIDNLAGGG